MRFLFWILSIFRSVDLTFRSFLYVFIKRSAVSASDKRHPVLFSDFDSEKIFLMINVN